MRLFIVSIFMPILIQSNSSEITGPILEMYLDNVTIYDVFDDNSTLFNSTKSNSNDSDTFIAGSGEDVSEGSGEEFIEQFRFVLPVRKRRLVEEDADIMEEKSSGNLIEEIHRIRKRESKSESSSSDNISIETLSRQKRSAHEDLEKVLFFNAIAISNSSEITDKQVSCISNEICYEDSDCNGGICSIFNGNFLKTCNCNACLNFWVCYSDKDCGGLALACNTTTHMCNCFGAFVLNGYSDTLDALARLCNVKSCSASTDSQDCFGLPCNTGRCKCTN